MPNFQSSGDVRRWLEARPEATRHHDAVVLAARSALRVLPLLYRSKEKTRDLPKLTAVVFRAIATARLLPLAPSRAVQVAAAAAAAFRFSADAAAAAAAAAPAFRAAAAAAAAPAAAPAFRAAAAAAAAAAFRALSADADRLEREGAVAALRAPLFGQTKDKEFDDLIANHWRRFSTELRREHPHFVPWIRWYERILRGESAPLEIEQAFVFLDAPATWDDPPDVVNAAIAKKLGEIEEGTSLEGTKKGLEGGTGGTIEIEDGQAIIKPVVSQKDLDAASDPTAIFFHDELKKELEFLKDQTRRFGNKTGWDGIDRLGEDYANFVNRRLEEIALEVAKFWLLSSKLGSLIDQDNAIRDGNQTFAEPLDADVRRAIENVLQPGAPLVRRFPTGLHLDEEYHRFRAPRERTVVAVEIVQNAQQQQIMHGPSAQLLLETHDASEQPGPQADKARSWASRMTKSLVLVIALGAGAVGTGVATGVGQKVGEKFAEKSQFAPRFADFLVKQEQKIVELLKDLPPDISAKIKEIIRRIKAGELPPKPPSLPPTTPV